MGVVPTTEIWAENIDPVTEARFWDLVAFNFAPDACWPFGGHEELQGGYRRFKIEGAKIAAHRVSYALEHGCCPAGIFVCHSCDNPQCVRPSHLFLGTARQNMEDKVAKGRQVVGADVGTAILVAEDVLRIRAELKAGRSLMSLAKEFGVAKRTIHKIKHRENWAHLAEAA